MMSSLFISLANALIVSPASQPAPPLTIPLTTKFDPSPLPLTSNSDPSSLNLALTPGDVDKILNSASLSFIPVSDLEDKGYGDYLKLFE